MEGLAVGARACHRAHDLLDALGRSLADIQPAPEGIQDNDEVTFRKTLPQQVGFSE
jgi:hypothetical protein